MRTFKVRTADGAAFGPTSATSLPDTATGMELRSTDDTTVTQETHYWSGASFSKRTIKPASTVRLTVGVPQAIDIPVAGWTSLDGQPLVKGPRSITATAAGIRTLTFSGEYAGAIALDARTIEDWRAAWWGTARDFRNARQEGGCNTPLGRVDTDAESQRKISGGTLAAVIAKTAGEPFSIDWTMASNDVVAHDADAMIAMGMAVTAYLAACQEAGTAVREAIFAAASLAALETVDITAGYPTA